MAFSTAAVVVRKPNGLTTPFIATADSDVARGNSLVAAVSAAASGDAVLMAAGGFTVAGNIAKNGISIYGGPDTTITYPRGQATCLFADANANTTFSLQGSIDISITVDNDLAGSFPGLCRLQNTASNFDLNFRDLNILADDGLNIGSDDINIIDIKGRFNLNARNVTIDNQRLGGITRFCWWTDQRADFRVVNIAAQSQDINTPIIYAWFTTDATNRAADCNLFLTANKIEAGSETLLMQDTAANVTVIPAVWVDSLLLEGSIHNYGGVKCYVETEKFNGTTYSNGAGNTTNTQIFITAEKWSNSILSYGIDLSSRWLEGVGPARFVLNVGSFEPVVGNVEMIYTNVAGVEVYLTAGRMPGAPSNAPITVSNGYVGIVSAFLSSDVGAKDLICAGGTISLTGGVHLDTSKVTVTNTTTGTVTVTGSIVGPQFPQHVVAAGTPYTITATSAAVVLSTTSPIVTLAASGSYIVRAFANLQYASATFAASRTVTVKLRRTNNTAADLTNGSAVLATGIVTSVTSTFELVELEATTYTGTTGDVLTIFADVSVVPTGGTGFQVVGAWIDARLVA